MKRTEKSKENNISCLPLSIKWVLGVVLSGICVWLISKIPVSVVPVIGIYILIRSVVKIIRLSVRVVFSLLSILCLVAICLAIITFIL